MNEYILIEYSNSTDLGDESSGVVPIVYHNTFSNRVYLDADVSKPQYELVEEGDENGHNEFVPTFKKWAKRYSVEFYAQEFLADALTLMDLHDQITITLKNGESSVASDISIKVDWDKTIECWAKMTIEFTTAYITSTNCNEDFDYGCQTALYTAVDVADADDSGPGQAIWDDPTSYNQKIYFFYVSSFGCGEYADSSGASIGFYKSVDGVWTLLDMDNGQFGEVTGLSTPNKMVRISSLKYMRVPYLCSVTDKTGGVAEVKMLSNTVENTFVQVQIDTGGGFADVGNPVLASALDNGLEVTTGAGVNIDFRLNWYTHGCDYGYSNVVTQTIT